MSAPPTLNADRTIRADECVLELLREEAAISRRSVQGTTVRVTTSTSLRDQTIEEALARESVEIERVAIGRAVEATPAIRQEGDVTILPVMEEVLVLERRLVLKEEVRIRRVRTTHMHRETVQLREQIAKVTRTDAGETGAGDPPSHVEINTERNMP